MVETQKKTMRITRKTPANFAQTPAKTRKSQKDVEWVFPIYA
jgi:hypothetical protein